MRKLILWFVIAQIVGFESVSAEELEHDLGRNAVRVFSAPVPLERGQSVLALNLAARMEHQGYRRVRERPIEPGEFFWGVEVFWIYRRAHLWGRTRMPAQLLKLELESESGAIEAIRQIELSTGETGSREMTRTWIEPVLLAESLTQLRAPRRVVTLAELPEHLWRAVLAIEDERFFEHPGIDSRAIARAAVANAKAGGVRQGGSTITQQLVKLRDLSADRTLGRKASEAVRALKLEAEYSKEDILSAYLNNVYFGHLEGRSLYGVGAAAQAFFSKPVEELTLGEAATLAAVLQGPNRLSPVRNPEATLVRQRLVLDRLSELEWMPAEEIDRALEDRLPRRRTTLPPLVLSRQTQRWIADAVREVAPGRMREGRGVVVETSLDSYLQDLAEDVVEKGLAQLRRDHRSLRNRQLSAAVLLVEAQTGRVLAHVGGDPSAESDDFDRVRSARRQPGSAVKPFVLLEALDGCGRQKELNLASRVADRPLTLELTSGSWSPRNSDGRFRGIVNVREILVDSLNVPTVRVAGHCGFGRIADRFERAGLDLPPNPPSSFVLGAVEVSPLQLTEAYTVFSTPGDRLSVRILDRARQPSGDPIGKGRTKRRGVARASSAFLVRDTLREAVESGTAAGAALLNAEAAGKTGTSSDRRDAWFVGEAGGLLATVWVGMDDGSTLGLNGAQAAIPLWRRLMESAVTSRPTTAVEEPDGLVRHWIDPDTGRRLKSRRDGAVEELFRRRSVPPRWRFLVAQGKLDPIE